MKIFMYSAYLYNITKKKKYYNFVINDKNFFNY